MHSVLRKGDTARSAEVVLVVPIIPKAKIIAARLWSNRVMPDENGIQGLRAPFPGCSLYSYIPTAAVVIVCLENGNSHEPRHDLLMACCEIHARIAMHVQQVQPRPPFSLLQSALAVHLVRSPPGVRWPMIVELYL